MNHGDYLQQQKGDSSLVVWKDQKAIVVLFNHISPRLTNTVERWNDDGEKVEIECHQAIYDYFHHARSVDVLNQLHYSYLLGRKARRCWPRLAWWLLDMCMVNAYKLWSMVNCKKTQLDFKQQLMEQLLDQIPQDQLPRRHGGRPSAAHALVKDHYLKAAGQLSDCVHCSDRSKKRVRSSFICHTCDVHLCVGECFALYHS